jgi:hypothetical protein
MHFAIIYIPYYFCFEINVPFCNGLQDQQAEQQLVWVDEAWMQVLAFKIQLLLWTTSTIQSNGNVIMPLSANLLSYSHLVLNGYQVQNWQIQTFTFLVNFFNIPHIFKISSLNQHVPQVMQNTVTAFTLVSDTI